ncbi:MAG: hypothetical protein CMQ17_13180 [Gammaproteobacteria bacterium]|nr:hypothetical protein [Gammaproteobacteria bacterium]
MLIWASLTPKGQIARLSHHYLAWAHSAASALLRGLFCTVFDKSTAHLHYASKLLQCDNWRFFVLNL